MKYKTNLSKIKKDKRGVSEMISYVLLIVIALGLSVGVYSWLKYYIPTQNVETCGQDYALTIKDFSCTHKNILIELENKGMFNITGFIIKADNSTNSKDIPVIPLDSLNSPAVIFNKDRYFFTIPLKPGDSKEIQFDYSRLGRITKIQIQPFMLTTKLNKTMMCERIIERVLDNCN